MNRVTTHSATFAINQLMVKSITRQILQHAEGSLSSGKISDEAQPRDGYHRAQKRDPGERHHPGRGRGDEHSPQERQDDSQEQGPREPRESLNQRKQYQILHLTRVSAPGVC